MSIRFLLLILALLSLNVQAQADLADLDQRDGLLYEPSSETLYTGPVHGQGNLEGQVEAGLRVGTWVWRYVSGAPEFQVEYDEAGQRVRSEGWHENGQQERVMTFQNGRPDGVMRHWDEHGTLRQEHTYRAGQDHGDHRIWDHTGALLYSAAYADGALNGPAVWRYPDGSKRWETHYTAGVRTGTWRQYDPEGGLQMETEWADGTLVRRHNPHAGH